MVNSRRSEFEIIEEILTLSLDGAKTTDILYGGYLSYTQLKKYVSFLIDKDILSVKTVQNSDGHSKIYKTTNKGVDLLKNIKKTLEYIR
jgi:predicted transcriptional regulator